MGASDRVRNRNRREARRLSALLRREVELRDAGCAHVAGVDEAGVGPLAGPVVAAAVVFRAGEGLRGVDDSKRLTAAARERLVDGICAACAAYRVVWIEPAEIDRSNIYRAGLEAMRRAVVGLDVRPDHVLVDARHVPGLPMVQEAVIRGDATCHAIAAASILAKATRDRLMRHYDRLYPGYGFAEHKGYPTVEHRSAIRRMGPCPIHRRTFTLLPHPRLFD